MSVAFVGSGIFGIFRFCNSGGNSNDTCNTSNGSAWDNILIFNTSVGGAIGSLEEPCPAEPLSVCFPYPFSNALFVNLKFDNSTPSVLEVGTASSINSFVLAGFLALAFIVDCSISAVNLIVSCWSIVKSLLVTKSPNPPNGLLSKSLPIA